MRMWMTPPETMCRKHLLGEHVELHMFVGTVRKGISVEGFLAKGLLEPASVYARHEDLVDEMTRRGYEHKSPLPAGELHRLTYEQYWVKIDRQTSLAELHRRCPECLALHKQKLSKALHVPVEQLEETRRKVTSTGQKALAELIEQFNLK